MSFDEFIENTVNDNSNVKHNSSNEKSSLFSKNNINTLLYSYLNSNNIKSKIVIT